MELVKVKSSSIDGVGYENKELTVKFKQGTTYKYLNVPKKVYDNMLKAESKGKYFLKEIKNKFKFQKVEEFCR